MSALRRLASALLLLASGAQAAPDARTTEEIGQLLTQLSSSGCEFQRNGDWHPAIEARAHLERKYAYLLKKGLVDRTEDFIDRAATGSSVTGKDYQMRCAGVTSASAPWLRAALARIRGGRR